ncbi:MAG TPA: SURF1 family protein [Acidimicrobiia bacterium]|jgi:surfeit locus 1 family protein
MRRLLAPRWLAAHVFVLAVCFTCVFLGFWQVSRLQERRLDNQVQAARLEAPPVPLEDMLEQAGADIDSLEYRRTTVTGVYRPENETLIRSQVFQGQAGFDVVTPLILEDGTAVAVNRGWVPLEFDRVPVTAAPPPEGQVTVEGIVRLSQPANDPSQSGPVFTRVDLDLIASYAGLDLAPVYVELVGDPNPTELPVVNALPDFTDEGPHLSYAIQWFAFAVVGVIGYGFLLRRAIRRSGNGNGETGDDLDAGQSSQVGPS